MDKLNKAKATLILDHPFFASLLLSMRLIERKDIKTMATDGKSLFYNSDFIESLSLQELVFVLAHEVLHVGFLHPMRKGERNHNRFNQAADYVINYILVQDGVGTMPSGGLYSKELYDSGKTAEGIYNLLPEDAENNPTGGAGGALDDLLDPTEALDPAELRELETSIQVKMIQAKNAARAAGKLSGGVSALVDSLTKTKKDWREVLRRFFITRQKIESSYARPNRRYLAEDFVLPSLNGEGVGKIAVAIDCSGSIDLELKKQFETELKAIFEDLRPNEIVTIYFDSEVLASDTITDAQDFALKRFDGGGTGFSCVFESLTKTSSDIIGCVVFTDLDSEDFGQSPGYPVLWASYGKTAAPFGEVLELKSEV